MTESDCGKSDSSICLILLGNPRQASSPAATLYSILRNLVNTKYEHDTQIKFVWTVKHSLYPTNSPLIAVRGKRQRFTTFPIDELKNTSEVAPDAVDNWIENILSGTVRFDQAFGTGRDEL